MRLLKIDLSNRITDYGAEMIYRKLFDNDTEHDLLLFDENGALRKLRLYYGTENSDNFLESVSENLEIGSGYTDIHILYKFAEAQNFQTIRRIVIETDDRKALLEITGQHLREYPGVHDFDSILIGLRIRKDPLFYGKIQRRKLNPCIITDFGMKFIYESLADLHNNKINFFYSGKGEPVLDYANHNLTHILDDVKITETLYDSRRCWIKGRKVFRLHETNISEMGIGLYLTEKEYLQHRLAVMDSRTDKHGNLYCIDRNGRTRDWALTMDRPVASLRIKDSDYACVFLGKYRKPDDSNFNNEDFTFCFWINLTYDIWKDTETLETNDDISHRELSVNENFSSEDSQIDIIKDIQERTDHFLLEDNCSLSKDNP